MKLEPSDFEAHADDGDENPQQEIEEDGKNNLQASSRDEELHKEQLMDELKKLDIAEHEEMAYVDVNYWKSSVNYDVDGLLDELNQ